MSNWMFNNNIVKSSFDINNMPTEFNLVPGDKVKISTDSNSHGISFCIQDSENTVSGQRNIINSIFGNPKTSTPLNEFPAFESVMNGVTIGTISGANTVHFEGTVQSGFSGTIVNCVCTFHGPNSMQFVLKIN